METLILKIQCLCQWLQIRKSNIEQMNKECILTVQYIKIFISDYIEKIQNQTLFAQKLTKNRNKAFENLEDLIVVEDLKGVKIWKQIKENQILKTTSKKNSQLHELNQIVIEQINKDQIYYRNLGKYLQKIKTKEAQKYNNVFNTQQSLKNKLISNQDHKKDQQFTQNYVHCSNRPNNSSISTRIRKLLQEQMSDQLKKKDDILKIQRINNDNEIEQLTKVNDESNKYNIEPETQIKEKKLIDKNRSKKRSYNYTYDFKKQDDQEEKIIKNKYDYFQKREYSKDSQAINSMELKNELSNNLKKQNGYPGYQSDRICNYQHNLINFKIEDSLQMNRLDQRKYKQQKNILENKFIRKYNYKLEPTLTTNLKRQRLLKPTKYDKINQEIQKLEKSQKNFNTNQQTNDKTLEQLLMQSGISSQYQNSQEYPQISQFNLDDSLQAQNTAKFIQYLGQSRLGQSIRINKKDQLILQQPNSQYYQFSFSDR